MTGSKVVQMRGADHDRWHRTDGHLHQMALELFECLNILNRTYDTQLLHNHPTLMCQGLT